LWHLSNVFPSFLVFLLGSFPFSFMFITFFGILCPFLKCVHTILFCYLLQWFSLQLAYELSSVLWVWSIRENEVCSEAVQRKHRQPNCTAANSQLFNAVNCCAQLHYTMGGYLIIIVYISALYVEIHLSKPFIFSENECFTMDTFSTTTWCFLPPPSFPSKTVHVTGSWLSPHF
jgi:hypothetical protein